jgi:excisionase family DNA binding protein
MTHSEDRLLTYRELRQALRCSQTTAETLVRKRLIRSVQVGDEGSRKPRRLFPQSAVDEYLAAHSSPSST